MIWTSGVEDSNARGLGVYIYLIILPAKAFSLAHDRVLLRGVW